MKHKKMVEYFKFYHNKKLGICTAVILPEDLEVLFYQEVENFNNFIRKNSGLELYLHPENRKFKKLFARSRYYYDLGDKNAVATAEKVAGARLRRKIVLYIAKEFLKYRALLKKLVDSDLNTYYDNLAVRLHSVEDKIDEAMK